MKSPFNEDTDEEDWDDPITLFNNNINAVYFGSQPHKPCIRDTESCWTFETIGNNEFRQPSENSICGRPDDDVVQTLRSGTISECDISPLSVKLVDCGKFPWYYRKYTQQIIHKLNLNEKSNHDDTDAEVVVDDSDDCFVVEDLQDVVTNNIITNNRVCIQSLELPESKPKLEKNKLKKILQKMKTLKDDREIQKALSSKNLVKVDLRRNQGLIGMKISQKIETTQKIEKTQKIERTQKIEDTTLDATTDKDLDMKIIHKIETNTILDAKTDNDYVVEEVQAKQKCAMANEKYLSAADKTLRDIGTQLISIKEEKENNSICQVNINNKEKDLVGQPYLVKPSSLKNITVKFDISKISEKLIDNLKTKKINEKSPEAKLKSKLSNKSISNDPENTFKTVNQKELNSKETISEKCTNSSTSHVKDVKKTNKYKNDRIKIENSASHGSFIGVLVTSKSKEDIKEIKCTKQKTHRDNLQNKVTKLHKKPCKKAEKQKREPKSPILHCSTVLKKPKQHGMPPKGNKIDTNSNIPKESVKLKQIVDKLSNLNSCNLVQDSNSLKHVIPKIAPVTKPFDVYTKQVKQKESSMVHDKIVSQVKNIQAESLNFSDELHKKCNEISKADFKTNFHNTQTSSLSQNGPLNEQNLQSKVNKHTMNTASVTNPTPKAPIKNSKPTVSTSNISSSDVVTPASGSNTVPFNQYANFSTPRGSDFSMHNAVPSKIYNSNMPNNNINVSVQNRYASAIILKSNNHANYPFEKYCEQPPVQTMAFQRPMTVLNHTQLQSRDPPPPYPIFYPPVHFPHSYFQNSANSVANQFHPPQSHKDQQPSNSMQNCYRERWLAPPPPPPPPFVPSVNFPPRNGYVVNQSKDCSTLNSTSVPVTKNLQSGFRQNSVIIQQNKNSSIIGINNDGLVKKINIVAMPAKKNNIGTGIVEPEQIKPPQIMNPVEHTEVVATKTEMLKELDKLFYVDENINDFKRDYPASVINENKTENTLEVAIMSKNPCRFDTLKLTGNQKDNLMQTKPAQEYSPPILPILTYKKILDRVNSNLQTQNVKPKIDLRPEDPRSNLKNECKPMRKRDFVKCCKRKLTDAWNNDEDSTRKDDAKKISIEEYKKRILKTGCKSEHYKKKYKEKYDNSGKQPNVEFKFRKNVDSTETDLGYDSDSTVVL